MRAGLESAGGRCEFSVEIDAHATRTYSANWGTIIARDIRGVEVSEMPPHEVLAAGFPCQPFSLAGVVKKQSLGRAHGFQDPTSGNLFFQIIRLIGGPWDLDPEVVRDEAEAPDVDDDRFAREGIPLPSMPPVLLLENVRHLLSHDSGRTFRVIRRRLLRTGYFVEKAVINAAAWVPQNRQRTFIVGLRNDLFDAPFVFPRMVDPSSGPRLTQDVLENDPATCERYRVTPGVWAALQRHRARHEASGNGFGYGIVPVGGVARTLTARYYKDGAEILVSMPDGSLPPRRLTLSECAHLMGFTKCFLGRDFVVPPGVSDAQAYRQFGNAVVVPQIAWIAESILEAARHVFEQRRTRGDWK